MSLKLRPFWCYYGGKYRIAPRYPAPVHDLIIEPFAGAAGYSTRHHTRNVLLYDADPVIADLWDYLIRTPAAEIRALPIDIASVDDVHGPQEAKSLIGFWLNKGTSAPCLRPSAWMRSGSHVGSFWGENIRERIATQVDHIRHWRVECATYDHAPAIEATWYVDPPYQGKAGRHYRQNAVDFPRLGRWCRSLSGQVIVCENVGADWLPFRHFADAKAMAGKHRARVSREAVWTNDDASVAETAA